MRKIANLRDPVQGILRVMLHEADGGTYLFLYESMNDGPCVEDQWYESLAEAERVVSDSYGVTVDDWIVIDEPIPGAQQDWIRPTRVKSDSAGNKLWGQFEAIPPAGTMPT